MNTRIAGQRALNARVAVMPSAACLQQILVQPGVAARFVLRGRFQLDSEQGQRVTKSTREHPN